MRLEPDFNLLQRQFQQARAGFLVAEVELRLTFSQLAIDAKDREKRLRCTCMAEKMACPSRSARTAGSISMPFAGMIFENATS